eukprot:1185325-Prorocentrum_minimum.AAC.2
MFHVGQYGEKYDARTAKMRDYEEEDEDRYGPEEEWQWGVSYETLKSRIALMVESAFMAADNIQGVSMTATPEQEQ